MTTLYTRATLHQAARNAPQWCLTPNQTLHLTPTFLWLGRQFYLMVTFNVLCRRRSCLKGCSLSASAAFCPGSLCPAHLLSQLLIPQTGMVPMPCLVQQQNLPPTAAVVAAAPAVAVATTVGLLVWCHVHPNIAARQACFPNPTHNPNQNPTQNLTPKPSPHPSPTSN